MYRAAQMVSETSPDFLRDVISQNLLSYHLDQWYRILLDKVPGAKPGVRRTEAFHNVMSPGDGHYYPSGHLAEPKWQEFINQYSMLSQSLFTSNDITIETIAKTVKLAAWALVIGLGLHNYFDRNGRLYRLLCNITLLSVFPFDIPICIAHDTFMSRTWYLNVIISCQNCHCLHNPASDCLSVRDMFSAARPGLMATMVLESCVSAC